jgi:hypothetical protein
MDAQTVRRFKKKFHLVERVAEKDILPYSSGLILSGEGKTLQASLTLPKDELLGRFSLLISPFADPESPLYFNRFGLDLIAISGAVLKDNQRKNAHAEITAVQRGAFPLCLGEKILDGPAIFKLYGKGRYLTEDPKPTELLEAFEQVPSGEVTLKYLFHSYCVNVYVACKHLYQLVRHLEDAGVISDDRMHLEGTACKCIYCLRTEGDFSTEEHVCPESLGNEDVILPPGTVCKECNNGVLSMLDAHLANHDLIAFLKVNFLPVNPKTGEYTKATFANFSMKRVSPSDIVIQNHGMRKKDWSASEASPGRFTIKEMGRVRFDPLMLGRCLYKIGLGMVAYHHGKTVALDRKYDDARAFILGKSGFPGHLVMKIKVEPGVRAFHTFLKGGGTLVYVNIFGVSFFFNLERSNPITPERVAPEWKVYPLFS